LRNVSLLISLMVVLGACGHNLVPDGDEINVYPTNYKSDILAAMHAYLNNPTGIRDAVISEPTLKSTGVVEQPDNLPLLGIKKSDNLALLVSWLEPRAGDHLLQGHLHDHNG
jgi:hypothetical protein